MLGGGAFYTDVVSVTALEDAKAASFLAPFAGYVVGANWEVITGVATAGTTFDAVVAGTGQATLDFIIPIAAAGHSGGLILDPSGWIPVAQGDTVVWTSDGVPSAGAADIEAIFSEGGIPIVSAPDTTDPATATTRDPRGTYTPYRTPDGIIEYKVKFWPSDTSNASSNGGLHGIPHYHV
jgi:hypothetical protein